MTTMELRECPAHDSPLKYTKISSKCDACYKDHHDNKQGYKCDFCEFCFHEECINANIPSRHKHPLKLIKRHDKELCCLCGIGKIPQILYQCSQCSFRICIPCARKPLIFNQPKAHDHVLLQVMIKLPFTCDACGLCSTEYPCLCLQCCFIIHRACILLPRVIYINRHDHRISRVSSLAPGKWICRVCYEDVNGEYGAYSCLVCSYVVHSKCATNSNIWDGRELEGVPEQDDTEESKPFEVIDQNLIKHFSHEHNLKALLSSSRLEEPREHCCACSLPFYSELCYKCTQCDFILHDACANLPLKKRHEISIQKLTLCAKIRYGPNFENLFFCGACRRYCTGFSYNSGDDEYGQLNIDVRCASISGAFEHESHPHWLFVTFDQEQDRRCKGCDMVCRFNLRCKDKNICGSWNLCFSCGTLPTLVRHKYDDHPLSLCYGEKNVDATYSCGICEEEVCLKNWFYKCNECGTTLHTKCAFPNLIHSKPGSQYLMKKHGSFNLLLNSLSRPICCLCKRRCMGDFVLNKASDTNIFICCSCGFTSKFIEGPEGLRLTDK